MACQQAKASHNRPRGLMEQLEIPARPWHYISMDWTNLPTIKDDNGKKYNQVLTVTDRASKQVILIPFGGRRQNPRWQRRSLATWCASEGFLPALSQTEM